MRFLARKEHCKHTFLNMTKIEHIQQLYTQCAPNLYRLAHRGSLSDNMVQWLGTVVPSSSPYLLLQSMLTRFRSAPSMNVLVSTIAVASSLCSSQDVTDCAYDTIQSNLDVKLMPFSMNPDECASCGRRFSARDFSNASGSESSGIGFNELVHALDQSLRVCDLLQGTGVPQLRGTYEVHWRPPRGSLSPRGLPAPTVIPRGLRKQ